MNNLTQIDSLNETLVNSPLGKTAAHINTYTPSLLFPIPRKAKRNEIGIENVLPFTGVDIWTAYEISWLNLKGKPVVAMGEFRIPCESPNIIESKSLKLYLTSFSGSKCESVEQVKSMIEEDLSAGIGAKVKVDLFSLNDDRLIPNRLKGICLDDLDIECSKYMPNSLYLEASEEIVEEEVYTHLLKSNCLVTGQPDWGSIEIAYRGPKINHAGLLKYIVSLRDHNEFHEQCVERIFCDLNLRCKPLWLKVYARYTRRGGLDINPYRVSPGTSFNELKNIRLIRQ